VIGSAWCRTFAVADAGYGFVASDVPEFSVGVDPGWRGKGVGTALLSVVIGQARQLGVRAISLSVEDGNPARRIYDRAGFVPVGRNGGSDTLLLTLIAAPEASSSAPSDGGKAALDHGATA
jgi:GNAT superfamily N-acetyltransferase